MNISTLSNQIEIAFWMGVVCLLRNRRMTRPALLALIALLSLLALLLTAFSWAYFDLPDRLQFPKAAAIHSPAYLARPENGQKNLLLVLVDHLSEVDPSLEGAWMLIYAPDGLKVTFMPVYPAESEAAARLPGAFRFAQDGDLPASFEQALQEQGLWWDNYLVVDHAVLADLVDLSGGIDMGNGLSQGLQVVDLLPIASQDAQTARQLQARIARGICQRFDAILRNASPEAIVDLLVGGIPPGGIPPSLALSDLTSDALRASWSSMRSAGGLDCEFPTLIGR
jgi:hypothetical protein